MRSVDQPARSSGDAGIDLADFDPFGHATQQCPHRYYERMRAECPVYRHEGTTFVFVTRYDDVLAVLRDTETFSSKFGVSSRPDDDTVDKIRDVQREGWPAVPTLLTNDPPAHDRLRRLVSKAFTPRQVARLEPGIIETAEALVDAFIDRGTCEFVTEFAIGLPVTTIARALNVPEDRQSDFKRWSDDATVAIGAVISEERRLESARGILEFQRYFAAQLEDRQDRPQDDILTGLNEARLDEEDGVTGGPLDMAEKLGIIQQLLVAGNETTTKLLTEAMRLLAEHPDEWRKLRSDPERAGVIVEECLRLASPTQGMFRLVTKDTEIGGLPVAKGTMVVAMFASANRDEDVFGAEPNVFDPDRENLRAQVAFGKGVHYCIGANLARLEAVKALEVLSHRLATIELADPGGIEYEPSFVLRGIKRLDLRFTPA